MRKGKQKSSGGGGRLLPNSIRIIGSCLRNVSANASTVASTVRSAGATVAASISASSADHKDQVTWAGFDKVELESCICRRVLLLGYRNGFQILDVEDASNFSELVSKRDIGLVTFLQMQPIPLKSDGKEGFKTSHPLLLVVAEDETNNISLVKSSSHSGTVGGDGYMESPVVNAVNCPTAVRFYSLKSHSFVHDLRFRSAVCMVRCSPRIVAVGLATQIHCYDALTLENKFSVLTYPVPQMGGQGRVCVNVGYGPMALGHRWLAYASNCPPVLNTGRLSPKSTIPSEDTSPSTSPSSSSVVARYAMESGWHLAAGIVNLGDKGYKAISKYYQEHLPDGSIAPTLVSTVSITSRPASTETDHAGVVVVKDCVSRAVISQFRAHSSPISALCFDPSGTLLVTASVHGNAINIFRIIPSNSFGSRLQNHDSSSSYIHVYKLHRGIRAAVIQDICFSHYSQWVAIVSSKGTCHVFVLSPFGGEVGFKVHNSQGEEPSLSPVLTPPWWSTSTFSMNHLSFSPPPPVSPVAMSRIWDNSSGLLNTVSNAAASVSGKCSIPSGALVAIFHNSMHGNPQQGLMGLKSLEHLLVFTPSGHVVQHEIRPSLGSERNTGGSRTQSFNSSQMQDAELSVCIQPLQWWDVCRRSDWPEREECISKAPSRRPELAGFLMRDSNKSIHNKDIMDIRGDVARKSSLKADSSSSHERIHWYLSNAEVQYNTGRIPVWQNPKIFFCMMGTSRFSSFAFGECEIEKIPMSQIEIRRKDLLPVFDHFHTIKPVWSERGTSGGKYAGSFPSESHYQKDRANEETIISHSKSASLSSTESSDGGSSRRMENLIDLDHISSEKPCSSFHLAAKDFYLDKQDSDLGELSLLDEKFVATLSTATQQTKSHFLIDEFCVQNELPSKTRTPSFGRTKSEEAPALNMDMTYKFPSLGEATDASNINPDVDSPLSLHNSLGLIPDIQGLCHEKLEMIRDERPKEGLEATDSLNREQEKEIEEDMFGAMFAFSEEGEKKTESIPVEGVLLSRARFDLMAACIYGNTGYKGLASLKNIGGQMAMGNASSFFL